MKDESDNSIDSRHNVAAESEAKREDAKMPDTLPDHSQAAAAELAAMSPEEYAAFEKKLMWKLDLKIIPWITLLYLMSFLDRVNIGVARLSGLTEDLNMNSAQFSNASMIFFVSYVAFEIPSNLVLKRMRPSRFIPVTMILWAIFQIFMGLVTTYGQLLALRFCLGLFEAGLFPGLNFALTGWYKRSELNKRCAVFFAGAVLAGAFGGIFGYALGKMGGVGGKNGWCWIFIWEGVLTLIIAIASFWMMVDWPDQAKFLTPLEKECVLTRLKQDQGLAGEGKFSWRVIRKGLKDWKVYCMMLIYIGAAVPIYSASLFTPSIIASLGRFTQAESLLLSTPPYVVAFCTTIGTGFLSDKFQTRGPFNMFWSIICVTGYIILICVHPRNAGPCYFAVFLTTMGAGPMIATTIAWTGNTWGNHYKRALAMGMVFSSGNSGGIVASQAYRIGTAPRYFSGHGTGLAFAAMNGLCSIILYIGLRRENARRVEHYGIPPPPGQELDVESDEYKEKWGLSGMTRDEIVELGDDHPAFRYIA